MKKGVKPILFLAVFALLTAITLNAIRNLFSSKTIDELLSENKLLKESITNLTQEEQIGYAKVTSKEYKDGKLFTSLKFVETARDDKLKKILEKNYTIEGDVIYFDAMIVKFSDKMVMDGKHKAIFLWRRIYGEKTAPENGFLIEEPGQEPARYADLLKELNFKDREVFWSGIWDLANEHERLKNYGIEAIYGNAVYHQLRAGLIYIFKSKPSGEVYPEVVPEM